MNMLLVNYNCTDVCLILINTFDQVSGFFLTLFFHKVFCHYIELLNKLSIGRKYVLTCIYAHRQIHTLVRTLRGYSGY